MTGDSGIVTADSGMPPKIGHVRPESPVTMNRNDRSRSSGIVGHVEPEYPTAEALRRIGELYAIEAGIRGKPAHERLRVRQEKAKPLLDSLEVWLRTKLQTLSRKSETAKAINYSLNQWTR